MDEEQEEEDGRGDQGAQAQGQAGEGVCGLQSASKVGSCLPGCPLSVF